MVFNKIDMDYASLYPSVMKDFTKDKKFMAELKKLERKRKLEKINQLYEQEDNYIMTFLIKWKSDKLDNLYKKIKRQQNARLRKLKLEKLNN